MKLSKYFAASIIGASLFTLSCTNNSPTQDSTVTSIDNTTEMTTPNVENAHAWSGTYTGTLPCASCPGINTELTLNPDNTYVLKEEYLEKKDGTFIEKGTYSFEEPNSTVTIIIGEEIKKYKVGNNELTALDSEGKVITGSHAAHFILKKKQ